ncbi:MAG: hypothetical protein B7Z10_06860, partial [Rhodobacterales bacterium 32-66-7]
RLHAAGRLLTEGELDWPSLGEGGRAFVLRETGLPTPARLAALLDTATGAAAAAVARLVGREGDG